MAEKQKRKVVLTDYREDLLKRLREDPDYALGLLKASLEEGEDAFLVSLKNVVDAFGGVTKAANATGLHRTSVHHILSSKGNPTLKNINAILAGVGMGLTVGRLEESSG